MSTSIMPVEGQKKSKNNYKNVMDRYGIFFVFLGLCVFISILTWDSDAHFPVFLKFRNIINVLRQSSYKGIIAIGVTFILITGGIDLSSGSLVAMIGVMVALLAREVLGLPVIVPVLAGIGLGAAAGAINGGLTAKFGIPPFIATLGMMTIARGIGFLTTNGRPVDNLSASFQWIGQGSILNLGKNFFIPIPVIIFLGIAAISNFLLKQTRFGKYTYALGGNEQAAYICGINVKKQKVLVYVFGGIMTSIAAIVLTARVSSGQPSTGQMFEMDAIAGAVIGGTSLTGGIGTIGGTVIGTLIIAVINNGLQLLGVSSYWQQIVKGLIIVIAVIIDTMRNKSKK